MSQHRDPEWLREKYCDEDMTDTEIAEIVGVDRSNVTRARHKFGIEALDRVNVEAAHRASRTHPKLSTSTRGYERIRHLGEECKHHRLLAIAWFGWDAVIGRHVHHENGLRWDNREENLVPMDPDEHIRQHVDGRRDPTTGRFV